ncbi:hypothetical protein CDAR_278071 [Caerostris darwini]|uniref:Cytochrome c biogenesis B n=1 Tax=Caerostris darwini TaxID=1538125 RepID=A0AAV4SDH2_9ARAC|nr:hypothetical protein CDAR_278071 [Caerostris darwini]
MYTHTSRRHALSSERLRFGLLQGNGNWFILVVQESLIGQRGRVVSSKSFPSSRGSQAVYPSSPMESIGQRGRVVSSKSFPSSRGSQADLVLSSILGYGGPFVESSFFPFFVSFSPSISCRKDRTQFA